MTRHRNTTAAERTMIARAGAYASWANTADPMARTAPGRAAAWSKFERDVDPDGTLDPAERERRAEYARKAHFALLAHKSARARRLKAGRTEQVA